MPSVPQSPSLYHSLLRPPILQILRAAGFHAARPTIVDILTDLAARYLLLLASSAATHVDLAHPETPWPMLPDILHALQEAGALQPQLSECEQWAKGEEDLRGLEALIGWMKGENVGGGVGEAAMGREIRRIAGFVSALEGKSGAAGTTISAMPGSTAVVAMEGGDIDVDVLEKEDYLTSLKKKHSKTGEESRYRGTTLGKDAEAHRITVEGASEGGPRTIKQWVRQTRKRSQEEHAKAARKRREKERADKEQAEQERKYQEQCEQRLREQREALFSDKSGSGSSALSSVRSSVEMDAKDEDGGVDASQMSVDG